jgi:hypothetical protein
MPGHGRAGDFRARFSTGGNTVLRTERTIVGNPGVTALKNVLRYLEDELQSNTKIVLGRSVTGCSVHEEAKTAVDFAKLQGKLEEVRERILELEKAAR